MADDRIVANEEKVSDMKYASKEVTQKETWRRKEAGNKEWERPNDL